MTTRANAYKILALAAVIAASIPLSGLHAPARGADAAPADGSAPAGTASSTSAANGPSRPAEPVRQAPMTPSLPAFPEGKLSVTAQSAPIFAYAHGTVAADGQFFIGMASREGNTFPTNEIVAFADPQDLSRSRIISLRQAGDIETMVYDAARDRIYFDLSSDDGLSLYMLDPHTYAVWTLMSTTSIDMGRKPAIATDGHFIYGVSNTDPTTVFSLDLATGAFRRDSVGHIPNGHSLALGGADGAATELYIGGGASEGFEKADAATLRPIAEISLAPCSITDDLADDGAYAYAGCEKYPYGRRVRTSDMSVTTFPLPGESFGLFIHGADLYNAAHDGRVDIFPGLDVMHPVRYAVTSTSSQLGMSGPPPALNEILFASSTGPGDIYFTAWWGVPGLYEGTTSALEGLAASMAW